MSSSHVIDAHALLWHAQGDPRLGTAARAVLEDPDASLVLPVIAFAEACIAVQRGRTRISHVQSLIDGVEADRRVRFIDVSKDIVLDSLLLTALDDLHDKLIVATTLYVAREQGRPAPLLTADRQITASNLVPIVW
jgi:PIN domain nuclease of toxin-antitoxin system